MAEYPDVSIEISIDQTLVDIVKAGFDAGIRLGEQVDKDMIAVPLGPDARMVVAAAPRYFDDRPTPKSPHDLAEHTCINLRMATLGGLYAWEFVKD